MKIIGLQLCPKRWTDEEYVESVRKLIARSKWFAIFHGGMAVLLLGCHLYLWRLIFKLDPLFCELGDTVYVGIRIGLMLGAFCGVLLIFAMLSIIFLMWHLKGQRTERLMLRFHDELKKQKPLQ